MFLFSNIKQTAPSALLADSTVCVLQCDILYYKNWYFTSGDECTVGHDV